MSLPTPYYDHAGITIYHGDCRDILPHLPKVDLVLTDPPYGVSYSSNYTCESTTAKWMNQTIKGDDSIDVRDDVLYRFSEWACFGDLRFPPHGYRGVVIWDKGPASGMGDLSWPFKQSWEMIFLSGKQWIGSRDEGIIKGKWVVSRASMGRTHPNEKSVSVMLYLLTKHNSKTILDPFMGSGTTLVAAKNLGRKAIGIEIEEKYCEIAVQRLSQEVMAL